MANSVVELVNISLGLIGVDFITSLEDNRKAAIVARKFYPEIRDAVLRSFTWNCATKRVNLAPSATDPVFEDWTYRFNLPSDCLRIISTYNSVPFEREGKTILANENSLGLEYIFRIEDPSLFDSLLTQAIQHRLSSALAIPLVEDKQLQANMWEMYKENMRQAKSVDSRETSARELDMDVWISASRGYSQGNFRNYR